LAWAAACRSGLSWPPLQLSRLCALIFFFILIHSTLLSLFGGRSRLSFLSLVLGPFSSGRQRPFLLRISSLRFSSPALALAFFRRPSSSSNQELSVRAAVYRRPAWAGRSFALLLLRKELLSVTGFGLVPQPHGLFSKFGFGFGGLSLFQPGALGPRGPHRPAPGFFKLGRRSPWRGLLIRRLVYRRGADFSAGGRRRGFLTVLAGLGLLFLVSASGVRLGLSGSLQVLRRPCFCCSGGRECLLRRSKLAHVLPAQQMHVQRHKLEKERN